MVAEVGFEPTTSGLWARCARPLHYSASSKWCMGWDSNHTSLRLSVGNLHQSGPLLSNIQTKGLSALPLSYPCMDPLGSVMCLRALVNSRCTAQLWHITRLRLPSGFTLFSC